MAALESCPKHNMVVYLEKTEQNTQFHEIVDFLTRSSIYYSLNVSHTVSTSLIEQFWNTATSKIVNNVSYIKAKVDGKAVSISEASIRRDLLFNDEDGIGCTNSKIYENLQLMRYEGDLTILTFQKALFSPQWKYLIHTLIHCLSSKSTSWDQFPTNIAYVMICLATDRKFNFSKMIFKGMIRNLDAKKKFLMYPTFVQVFLNNHLSNLPVSLDNFPIPVLTKKVFTNMTKKGLHFSGHVTPLFPNMLTPTVVDEGEGSEQPTEPQPTPSPTQHSIGDQHPMTESSSRHDTTQVPRVNIEGTSGSQGDQVQIPTDSPSLGGPTFDRAEGGLNLDELFVLCTNLSNRILALETFKDAQAAEILKLKARIKKLEKKSKPGRKKAKPGPTLDDSTFDDLDVDLAYGMDYMETEEAVNEGRQSNETEELNLDADTKVIAEDKGSGEKGGSIVDTVRPEVDTARPDVDTARQEVGTADPTTPPTTTTIFDDEEMTLEDTMVKMKDDKAKGVAFKDTEELVRPAKSVLTLKPLLTIDPKDKGKSVIEEPEPAKKMTKSDFYAAQVARDEEVARKLEVEWQAEVERERQRQEQASMDYIANLYDEVQARIYADHELAVRWTHEEQEKYTVDERAKLLAEFFERRKKRLAEERAAAIRNKPPTRTQLRSLMMTYLKHTGRFKHSQLNKRTFEEIQALYIKEQERATNFMPIRSEEDERQIQKMNKKVASVHEEKLLDEPDSTKIEDINKKAKGESTNKEEEQLKAFLNIVHDDEREVNYEVLDKRVFRADGSSRYIKTFIEMVSRFDRLDFIELHSLVMQRFVTTTPEGIDLVLWGDLRIMFEENANDDLWKNQEEWILRSWNFYENCRVHILVLEDGTEFYMLAERRVLTAYVEIMMGAFDKGIRVRTSYNNFNIWIGYDYCDLGQYSYDDVGQDLQFELVPEGRKLIQKLRDDQKCMKKFQPSSRSKATKDIISIGSFVEVLVFNHYVLVRKILGKLSKLHDEVAQNKTNIQ
ncbi:hypothetical protein Tco_0705242 [Tanacetum coccineum]|uniref:Uncharacterized protein n=1 Tax=Tanacetum coccineum TaxID=301880 RepID=A0ABQ4Y467_9ASTR